MTMVLSSVFKPVLATDSFLSGTRASVQPERDHAKARYPQCTWILGVRKEEGLEKEGKSSLAGMF